MKIDWTQFESQGEPQGYDEEWWDNFESAVSFDETSPIEETPSRPAPIQPKDTGTISIIKQMVKDSLFGELPAGLGYLQKPLEEAIDYWGKYTMSEEEEMEMARKHPNLMAARYAAGSLLLPGVSEYITSAVDWNKFAKKPIEEQRLEILGTTAAYVAFGAGFKWGTEALSALGRAYPWMTKPIIQALKEANWFRRMTNKERGLVAQTINDMKNAGLGDAQILKNLRKRSSPEYKAYFQEAVRKRATGEMPSTAEPTAPIIPPVKPVEPSPPPSKVAEQLKAAIEKEREVSPLDILREKEHVELPVKPREPEEILRAKLEKPSLKEKPIEREETDVEEIKGLLSVVVKPGQALWKSLKGKVLTKTFQKQRLVKALTGKELSRKEFLGAAKDLGIKGAARIESFLFMPESRKGHIEEAFYGLRNLDVMDDEQTRIYDILGLSGKKSFEKNVKEAKRNLPGWKVSELKDMVKEALATNYVEAYRLYVKGILKELKPDKLNFLKELRKWTQETAEEWTEGMEEIMEERRNLRDALSRGMEELGITWDKIGRIQFVQEAGKKISKKAKKVAGKISEKEISRRQFLTLGLGKKQPEEVLRAKLREKKIPKESYIILRKGIEQVFGVKGVRGTQIIKALRGRALSRKEFLGSLKELGMQVSKALKGITFNPIGRLGNMDDVLQSLQILSIKDAEDDVLEILDLQDEGEEEILSLKEALHRVKSSPPFKGWRDSELKPVIADALEGKYKEAFVGYVQRILRDLSPNREDFLHELRQQLLKTGKSLDPTLRIKRVEGILQGLQRAGISFNKVGEMVIEGGARITEEAYKQKLTRRELLTLRLGKPKKPKEVLRAKLEERPKKPPVKEKPEAILTQVNKGMPGNALRYDGEWEPAPGEPVQYQFTPTAGPIEGATFVVDKLDAETVKAKLGQKIKEFKKPTIEGKPKKKAAKPTASWLQDMAYGAAKERISLKEYLVKREGMTPEIAQRMMNQFRGSPDKEVQAILRAEEEGWPMGFASVEKGLPEGAFTGFKKTTTGEHLLGYMGPGKHLAIPFNESALENIAKTLIERETPKEVINQFLKEGGETIPREARKALIKRLSYLPKKPPPPKGKPPKGKKQKEDVVELFSGIPFHKFDKEIIDPLKNLYLRHVGDPLWNFLTETLPVKAGKKSKFIDYVNKQTWVFGLRPEYRKDPKFVDLRDDTQMKIQQYRERAKELAEAMAKFPRAEQIRIAQIIKGGVTAAPKRYEAAFESIQRFQELEEDLHKLGILGPDNRFRQLSRKEIADRFRGIGKLDKEIVKFQKRLQPIEKLGRVARKISEDVSETITRTEKKKTAAKDIYETAVTKWTELNEQRTKEALLGRGFAEGEATQMIRRIKESVVPLEGKKGTVKEITKKVERTITKTIIKQVLKTKVYHPSMMLRARASLVKDINKLMNKRSEILERIRLHYRMSGKLYLKRAYEKIEAEKKFANRLLSYLRRRRPRLVKGYEKQRKDLSKEYRRSLGEIEQAPFLAYKGLSEESHDVELMKMFVEISKNKNWAISPEEWANIQTVKGRQKLIKKYENFKPLPTTEKLGPLSGALVDPYIWDDLNQAVEIKGDLLKAYESLLSLWKTGKVVYNPATQARNIISNSILADFGDLPQWRIDIYARAAKDFATKSGYWLEATKNTPLLGREWAAAEAIDFLKATASLKQGNFPTEAAKLIAKYLDKPKALYQFWEQFFKLAIYINERQKGVSIKPAYKKAEKHIFNYNSLPPAVRWAKRWYSPFITFSYKALPLFAETAVRKPWKLAKYFILFAAVEEITRRMMGESKEEVEREKKILPDYMRKSIFPGQFSHLRIPYKDKWGRSKYLDLSYILPWGDVAEQWGQSHLVGRPFLPTHPAWVVLGEIAFNEILFTGRDLTIEDLDEGSDYWKKIGTQLWRQAVPSLAGSYSYNKIMSAMKSERDWRGRERSIEEAVFDVFFGLKIRSIDYYEELDRRINELDRHKNELRKRFRRDYRKIIMNPTPDRDYDIQRQRKLFEKLDEAIEKIISKTLELQE